MPNFDEKTGIRYGVISPNSISSECDYDLYQGPNCKDPHYESARADIIGGLNIVFENAGIWNEEKQNDILIFGQCLNIGEIEPIYPAYLISVGGDNVLP
jgi:hypothetical protein